MQQHAGHYISAATVALVAAPSTGRRIKVNNLHLSVGAAETVTIGFSSTNQRIWDLSADANIDAWVEGSRERFGDTECCLHADRREFFEHHRRCGCLQGTMIQPPRLAPNQILKIRKVRTRILSVEVREKLKSERGVYLTSACDTCGKLLGRRQD